MRRRCCIRCASRGLCWSQRCIGGIDNTVDPYLVVSIQRIPNGGHRGNEQDENDSLFHAVNLLSYLSTIDYSSKCKKVKLRIYTLICGL